MKKCKVVFLDRDGVINKRPPMHEYVSCEKELIVLPGVAEAIRRLNKAGLFVFVISNQRGVSRGLITMQEIEHLHEYLNEILGREDAAIDGFYVCPHGENECTCRKPAPGLLYMAEEDLREKGYEIDKEHSVVIGDTDTDIEAGNAYGVKGIRIGDGPGEVKDLPAAVEIYLNLAGD